jgi:MAP/microtubule affinity-regulating kinase
LIDESSKIKLIDFGFCEKCGPNQKLSLFCGTPHYMDPDICQKRDYNAQASDVWALGVLLFIILVGKLPFFAEFEADLYRKIKRAKYELPKTISADCRDLMSQIFQTDAHKRITAAKVLEHSWFKE